MARMIALSQSANHAISLGASTTGLLAARILAAHDLSWPCAPSGPISWHC
jgi:hypothetical protein